MAAKRDEVTIREVYELLDRMRREWDERESIRVAEAKAERASFEKRIDDLYVEVYGEGETRGLKSRISANEIAINDMYKVRGIDSWKSFIVSTITSTVAGFTTWAAITFSHK